MLIRMTIKQQLMERFEKYYHNKSHDTRLAYVQKVGWLAAANMKKQKKSLSKEQLQAEGWLDWFNTSLKTIITNITIILLT